jgi:hypothetical protein
MFDIYCLLPPYVPGDGDIYYGTSLSADVIGLIIVFITNPL